MPGGKPAGVRCVQLTDDLRCALYGRPERPAFCVSLRPSIDLCGDDGRRGDAPHRRARGRDPARSRPPGGCMTVGSFDALSPDAAVQAIERAFGVVLDGTLDAYPSYVNRVYGVRREDGEALVAKFYRPGRWTRDAILDEHRFLRDLAGAEIPVIAPLDGTEGRKRCTRSPADGDARFFFAVFPKAGGRTFEPESGRRFPAARLARGPVPRGRRGRHRPAPRRLRARGPHRVVRRRAARGGSRAPRLPPRFRAHRARHHRRGSRRSSRACGSRASTGTVTGAT